MKSFKTTVMSLMCASLLVAAPAFATPNSPETMGVVNNEITTAATEIELFNSHLDMAKEQLEAGNYDSAYRQANDARYWFLALADSVATERSGYSWDTVREVERNLLESYMDLGQLYHITGNYQQAVNTMAMSLSVNPYQPDARYQQMLAYIALEDVADANDEEVFDANDIERLKESGIGISDYEDEITPKP